MDNDLHTIATMLTYYLLDNDFCVRLAKDGTFAPYFPKGIDALVERMKSLLDGVDPSLLGCLRKKADFYKSFLE